MDAARTLQDAGAGAVVVSRAEAGTIAVVGEDVLRVVSPELTAVDSSGAGDSMTAALATGTSEGMEMEELLRFATAAGSLNVTRHGLATGFRPTIDRLSRRVEVSHP